MTTSGVTAFEQTTNDIIKRSLRQIGVVAAGDTPGASDYAAGKDALNAMVKAWEAEGIHLWQQTEDSLTVTASQASYTFGPSGDKTYRPLRITSLRSKVSASATELPCRLLSRDEYFFGLVNKTTTGQPNSFYYDPQVGTGRLYLWPAPAVSTYVIDFTYVRSFEIFNTTTNTPDFPSEWTDALTWNLAVNLAPEYGKQPNPLLVSKAIETKEAAKGWDQDPGPLQFMPEWEGRGY